MPNLLKKLKVTSVDLCKRGANQEAHIMLAKSAEGGEGEMQYDKIGKAFAFAFGLDADKDFDRQLTAMNKAMIESERSIKKSRLSDEEKDEMLEKSIGEFGDALIELLKEKMPKQDSADEPDEEQTDEEEVDMPPDDEGGTEDEMVVGAKKKKPLEKKGACKKMQHDLDVEKMSPEDKAAFEALNAKYGVKKEDKTEKAEKTEKSAKPEGADKDAGDVHPEVKKALDEVANLRKELEMSKLLGIAKQYECVGKKPDELAATLYDLKKSGDGNYNSYVAVLDEMKKTMESSGLFKEMGSSRSGETATNLGAAVAEIIKSDPKLSQAEAVVKAYELHPELSETL